MSQIILRYLFFCLVAFTLLGGLVACGTSPQVNTGQPVITINSGFQSSLSPIPTLPPYRCGAWASNNAPNPSATILIYARLVTQDAQGVTGIKASATAHFQSHDLDLGQTTSDSGGYVVFTLPLRDQQPSKVPATVSVTFAGLPKGSLSCTPAFFTPH